jgi:hypothetical protein
MRQGKPGSGALSAVDMMGVGAFDVTPVLVVVVGVICRKPAVWFSRAPARRWTIAPPFQSPRARDVRNMPQHSSGCAARGDEAVCVQMWLVCLPSWGEVAGTTR